GGRAGRRSRRADGDRRRARPLSARGRPRAAALARQPPAGRVSLAESRLRLRAVLFDVDFTLAEPGPDLGPQGYRLLGERFGLRLDPARYDDARVAAIANLKRHPELDHDEEVWVAFTEAIVRGMGGEADSAHECARAMTRRWEESANFELFEDALPVLAEL